VRAAPLTLVLLATLLVGCSDDGGVSYSSDVTNAEAAAGACGLLVTWTNDVAEAVNDTQDEMVEGADIQALMQSTLEDLVERTEALRDDLEALGYPDTDGGHAFADELVAGAEAAKADLAEFLGEVEGIPDPDPEVLQFRREQMVVELEKPRSLVKPDVQGDLGDEDLEAAIADEESCGFVTRSQ
jgi:hypothetical protein